MGSIPPEVHGERRMRMVEHQILDRGVRDANVIAALRSVPRHLFIPEESQAVAYSDNALPIGSGQTISQPFMVALMTSLLELDVRSRVLEVGTGSGYQAAVLAELADTVYSIERLPELAARARAVLDKLGYRNVVITIGDGSQGLPEQAPFDGIIVTAAATAVPPALLEQLAPAGRLVIPVGPVHREQILTVFERGAEGLTRREEIGCRFVPLIAEEPGEGRGPEGQAGGSGRRGSGAP